MIFVIYLIAILVEILNHAPVRNNNLVILVKEYNFGRQYLKQNSLKINF